jgi:outer membrane protein assembly factor BamB/mono/diheme cytochrome c family protein
VNGRAERSPRRWSRRTTAPGAGLTVVLAALALAACGGNSGDDSGSTGSADSAASGEAAPAVASHWTMPNGDSGNTRSVRSEIDGSSVGRLGLAWSVPIRGAGVFGNYATTPVVVDGVVYTQNLTSDVQAIDLDSGRVLWTKTYGSPDTGPNGVTVSNGRVYGATQTSAFALDAASGRQLWIRTLVRNGHEGIDMAPGINGGTVYVSTVPGNPRGFYSGNGQAILWAMDVANGAVKWKWKEVPDDLWGEPKTNSGGGQWEPPTFDAEGNVYVDVSNPAPFVGSSPTRPSGDRSRAFGGSRPGANLYTDSVVKLDAQTGRLLWHYQLLAHDVYDWDLNNSPLLAHVNGSDVVVSAGKGGIAIANDAASGRLLWRTPLGRHNGHDSDNLYALHGQTDKLPDPASTYKIYPGILGGVESPYASDGRTVYMAVNDLAAIIRQQVAAPDTPTKGTGEMVAIDIATGAISWQHRFDSSPYGAAAVTNDLVFTTTFDGRLWALDTSTGDVVWQQRLPAGTNAPVAIDGDTVLTAGSFPAGKDQRAAIVAYRLGASGGPSQTSGGGAQGNDGGSASSGAGASTAAGRAVFSEHCASCHTLAAANANGNVGPNLDDLQPDRATVQQQVINGGGGMPAFGGQLSRAQIQSVAQYVASVAGKGGGGGGGGANGGSAP